MSFLWTQVPVQATLKRVPVQLSERLSVYRLVITAVLLGVNLCGASVCCCAITQEAGPEMNGRSCCAAAAAEDHGDATGGAPDRRCPCTGGRLCEVVPANGNMQVAVASNCTGVIPQLYTVVCFAAAAEHQSFSPAEWSNRTGRWMPDGRDLLIARCVNRC